MHSSIDGHLPFDTARTASAGHQSRRYHRSPFGKDPKSSNTPGRFNDIIVLWDEREKKDGGQK